MAAKHIVDPTEVSSWQLNRRWTPKKLFHGSLSNINHSVSTAHCTNCKIPYYALGINHNCNAHNANTNIYTDISPVGQNKDLMTAVFKYVAPCSLRKLYQCFRGTCYLHHQDKFTPSWWWKQQFTLKYKQTSTRLHSITCQKTTIFIGHAVTTSNLAYQILLLPVRRNQFHYQH